jgi:hypothetical protein
LLEKWSVWIRQPRFRMPTCTITKASGLGD